MPRKHPTRTCCQANEFSALVAPYRAIPRDHLSDTPYCALWGSWCSTWPIARDTPSFSECFPLAEHAKWRCDTPPRPQKGELSDTCAILYENKENARDTPLCDTILKGYCAIWAGISHWATKFSAEEHLGSGNGGSKQGRGNQPLGSFVRVARLQNEVGTNAFCSRHEFSSKKCSDVFPENVEPLFCGSEKNPEKFLQNFPQSVKNSPTSFCKRAGRIF